MPSQRGGIPVFAIIGILTVAGACCFAAVTAVVLYRMSVQELAAEVDVTMTLSGPWLDGLLTRLKPPEYKPAIHLNIGDLKVQSCDDIVYAFMGLDDTATNIRCKLLKYDFRKDGLKRFAGLKRSKPEVNVWVCLGGSTDGTWYAALVREQSTRVTFVRNSSEWLQRNAFHGVLLYWKYPAPEHRINFTVLLAYLRSACSREELFVSAVLPASTRQRRETYLVQSVYENLDMVLVHGDRSVDPCCSPLTACSSPVRTLLRAWRQGQCGLLRVLDGLTLETRDFRKTVLGVPYTGVLFALHSKNSNHVGAAAAGPGMLGARTSESGVLSDVEVGSVCATKAGSAATTATVAARSPGTSFGGSPTATSTAWMTRPAHPL